LSLYGSDQRKPIDLLLQISNKALAWSNPNELVADRGKRAVPAQNLDHKEHDGIQAKYLVNTGK
jgi:hypothetical protein